MFTMAWHQKAHQVGCQDHGHRTRVGVEQEEEEEVQGL